MMRSLLIGSIYFASMVSSGELAGLSIHSIIFLGVGLAIFSWGYYFARVKGTLAHY